MVDQVNKMNEDDRLNSLAGEQPVDLINLIVDEQGDRIRFPEKAIKNRAAYAALLSGSPNLTEIYQSVIAEHQQGTNYTQKAIIDQAAPQAQADAKSGAIQLLGDPNVPFEQKQQIIKSLNDGFVTDPATMVANAGFSAPSKGETQEAEDVRISAAEQWRSINEYNQFKQGIINRQEAIRYQNGQVRFFDEFIETLLPFATNINSARNLKKLSDDLKLPRSGFGSFVLPGSVAKDISDALNNMPPEQRHQVSERLYHIIENNNQIMFPRDNQFNATEMTKKILSGEYGTFDKVLDNSVALLDVFALGIPGMIKSGIKKLTSKAIRTPEIVEQKITQRSVVDTTQPAAPLNVLKESNPEKARAAYAAIVKSEGDEVSEALTGTNRADAIAAESLPQPGVVDGSVDAKIVDPDGVLRTMEPDPEIKKAINENGGYHWTQRERVAAQSHVLNDMHNLDGLTSLDNMTHVSLNGDKVVVTGMFGNMDGGFKHSEEAFNQAKFALSEYGITDDQIKLFKKIDGEYVPVGREEAKLAEGNYAVGVDFDYKFTAKDIGPLDELDVKLNFFDRIPALRSQKAGTAANHLVTHASMLHPQITGSASVAVDNSVKIDKLFLEMHSKFTDEYVKLPKARQEKLYDHLKEANYFGLELSDAQLLGKGFTSEEIDLVKTWRKNWDTHFYYENADLAQTLRNQNFHVFEANGDKFFVKPVGKNGNIPHLYDPATNQVRTVDRLEMDQLYDAGGTFAEFRRPVKINGVDVEHMIVRNTPTEYMRRISDLDQILNYKKGYFQVGYKAPFFITEKAKVGGKEFERAVALAGSTEEANHIKQRMMTSLGKSDKEIGIRNDAKDFRPDTDMYWDLQHASGRVAQRHRGMLLEDATSSAIAFTGKYTLDPVESAVRASRSLSTRIGMRDMLEAHRARAMQQYEEFFPKVEGQRQWTSNSNSLIAEGKMDSKGIADARTTVEYLNFLQRGYENSLDDVFKGAMNAMAKLMARIGTKHGEQAFLWAKEGRPVELLKNGVFQAYLATNPARQFLVQGHQSIRLLGYNPKYMLSGRSALDAGEYFLYASGIRDISKASKETKEMVDFVKKSGMLDAVDKHNLVAGSIAEMTKSSNKATRVVGKAFEYPRRIGFDAGEQASLISHILAVRDRYIRAGKNVNDPYIRDEVYSVARALSYDMNRAGDMPYNSNSFGLFLQFLQVPHKAVAAVTTNRRIPVADKIRMAAMDIALFGVPGGAALYNLLPEDVLPEDPKGREAVVFGATSVAYNSLLQSLGATQKTDFSSLAPYGVDGFARLFESILSGGLEEFYTNSPSATFYFNENSRMREALSRMVKWVGFIDTEEGHQPEDIISVLKGVFELSSGWTNTMKARMIYESGKLVDKSGKILASDLNWVNSAAQVFGLTPMEVKLGYDAMKAGYKDEKSLKAEVDSWYKSYIRGVARDGIITNQDPEFQIKVLGAAQLMFKDNLKAQEMIRGYLQRDVVSQQDRIIKPAMDWAGLTNEPINQSIENLRMLNNDDYNKAIKLMEDMREQTKKHFEE